MFPFSPDDNVPRYITCAHSPVTREKQQTSQNVPFLLSRFFLRSNFLGRILPYIALTGHDINRERHQPTEERENNQREEGGGKNKAESKDVVRMCI